MKYPKPVVTGQITATYTFTEQITVLPGDSIQLNIKIKEDLPEPPKKRPWWRFWR